MLSTGHIGRAWAANYTTTSRLPLHPSFGDPNDDFPPLAGSTASRLPTPLSHAAYSFVHGGLAPNYPQLSPFPSAINALGRSLLRKLQHRVQPPPHPPNAYPGLPSSATSEELDLYGSGGPLWYRGWATNDEVEVCREVDAVLEKTGTRRMIMGHTPNFEVCESLLRHRVTFTIRRRKSCRVATARSLLLILVSTQVDFTHSVRKSEDWRRHFACIWRRAICACHRIYPGARPIVRIVGEEVERERDRESHVYRRLRDPGRRGARNPRGYLSGSALEFGLGIGRD